MMIHDDDDNDDDFDDDDDTWFIKVDSTREELIMLYKGVVADVIVIWLPTVVVLSHFLSFYQWFYFYYHYYNWFHCYHHALIVL